MSNTVYRYMGDVDPLNNDGTWIATTGDCHEITRLQSWDEGWGTKQRWSLTECCVYDCDIDPDDDYATGETDGPLWARALDLVNYGWAEDREITRKEAKMLITRMDRLDTDQGGDS